MSSGNTATTLKRRATDDDDDCFDEQDVHITKIVAHTHNYDAESDVDLDDLDTYPMPTPAPPAGMYSSDSEDEGEAADDLPAISTTSATDDHSGNDDVNITDIWRMDGYQPALPFPIDYIPTEIFEIIFDILMRCTIDAKARCNIIHCCLNRINRPDLVKILHRAMGRHLLVRIHPRAGPKLCDLAKTVPGFLTNMTALHLGRALHDVQPILERLAVTRNPLIALSDSEDSDYDGDDIYPEATHFDHKLTGPIFPNLRVLVVGFPEAHKLSKIRVQCNPFVNQTRRLFSPICPPVVVTDNIRGHSCTLFGAPLRVDCFETWPSRHSRPSTLAVAHSRYMEIDVPLNRTDSVNTAVLFDYIANDYDRNPHDTWRPDDVVSVIRDELAPTLKDDNLDSAYDAEHFARFVTAPALHDAYLFHHSLAYLDHYNFFRIPIRHRPAIPLSPTPLLDAPYSPFPNPLAALGSFSVYYSATGSCPKRLGDYASTVAKTLKALALVDPTDPYRGSTLFPVLPSFEHFNGDQAQYDARINHLETHSALAVGWDEDPDGGLTIFSHSPNKRFSLYPYA